MTRVSARALDVVVFLSAINDAKRRHTYARHDHKNLQGIDARDRRRRRRRTRFDVLLRRDIQSQSTSMPDIETSYSSSQTALDVYR